MIIHDVTLIWLFSIMVFYANPLNDSNNPCSEMNRYHPLNNEVRAKVERMLEAEGEDKVMRFEWPDVAPYLNTTSVTVLCLVIKYLLW